MTLKNLRDLLTANNLFSNNLMGTSAYDTLFNGSTGLSGIWKDAHIAYQIKGLKGLGSELAKGATALIKAHPVITTLAAAAAIGWGLDKTVFNADEKFEHRNKSR